MVGLLQNDLNTDCGTIVFDAHASESCVPSSETNDNDVPQKKKTSLSAAVKVYVSGPLVRQIMKRCKCCKTCYYELSTGNENEHFIITASTLSPKALCHRDTKFSKAFVQIGSHSCQNTTLGNSLFFLAVKVMTYTWCKSVNRILVGKDVHLSQMKAHRFNGDFVKQLAYTRYLKYRWKE
ncbi:hypothetical protein PR048_006342 [Dryococelus australis]|uniref:Uncharacterized protein n=1 Tax=Dryococelus australis TaxID=614101 RepID=A0ABQ9IAS2_9NEOP|nr:hypothetical protein PR048_006342 [Dryococelus australis]